MMGASYMLTCRIARLLTHVYLSSLPGVDCVFYYCGSVILIVSSIIAFIEPAGAHSDMCTLSHKHQLLHLFHMLHAAAMPSVQCLACMLCHMMLLRVEKMYTVRCC